MKSNSSEILENLAKQLSCFSNPDYRFLSRNYSPTSRTPCADLTSFFIQQMQSGEIEPIKKILVEVISANPGLGTGPEWIEKLGELVINTDFNRYFEDPTGLYSLELKALFLLATVGGGQFPFLLAGDFPALFAKAICCRSVVWLPTIGELAKRGNNFISKMAKDTPFWTDYPLFGKELTIQQLGPSVFGEKILKMSLLSRIHLFSLSQTGGGNFVSLATHKMKSLGLNVSQTIEEIRDAGLVELIGSDKIEVDSFTKDDLVKILSRKNAIFKKSWDKQTLYKTAIDNALDDMTQSLREKDFMQIKSEFLEDYKTAKSCAESIEECIKLLCFTWDI